MGSCGLTARPLAWHGGWRLEVCVGWSLCTFYCVIYTPVRASHVYFCVSHVYFCLCQVLLFMVLVAMIKMNCATAAAAAKVVGGLR